MSEPVRVFLADVRHNFRGVLVNDCMPLGIAYMKAVMDHDFPVDAVESGIFAYPQPLLQAMKADPPDIFMSSNYVWNEALSHFFLRLAKQLNPSVLTVMGGPNIPVEPERQIQYVADHPWVDVYVCGEGDFVAAELVRRYRDAGGEIGEMFAEDIPSCVFRRDGELMRTATAPRPRTLADIPSPYLSGLMDEFFDNKMSPLMETNRGCPFRCTFCVQGTSYYTKVAYFDFDRVCDELSYVGKMIKKHSPDVGTLRIADPNYGMYERDVEVSAHIGKVQKQYGWPTYIDATTGKNRADRVIKSLENIGGALVLYQAVQSLDEDVLRNIERSNIKLEAYERIAIELRGRGLRPLTQLILGLPGESEETHLRGLYKMIDAGAEGADCFQVMLLKGSEMESLETRAKFDFDSRYRVLPKNFGIYDGKKVFDIEEISVATNTLPFDDYIECRKHHFGISVFSNDNWFKDVQKVAQTFGIETSRWLRRLVAEIDDYDAVMGRYIADFVAETKGELFETKEACAEFYGRDENFELLSQGKIGDNLMYKYRAIGSFILWKELCGFVMDVTRRMILEASGAAPSSEFKRIWQDLHAFTEASHGSGLREDELFSPVTADLHYDIPRWLEDGAPHDFDGYRFDGPHAFVFKLSQEGEAELRSALKVWTTEIIGLSKLVTRIRVASQRRNCEMADPPRVEQLSA